MAWNNTKGVQHQGRTTAYSLSRSHESSRDKAAAVPLGRRGPGGSQPQQTPITPGSKRWSAQQRAGWNCPKCTYYNFGFRTTCF
eukprot:5745314-Amphidinium_carterae.1